VLGLHNPDPGERLNALAVDLRGWGDSAPALYPYDMVGWGAPDRIISYMCAALGDPLLSQRTRDALAALAWLRVQGMERIVIAGFGLAGWVALHAAAIDGNVSGVVTAYMPASLHDLVEAERYDWPAGAFWPEMLKHYDIPELAGALSCPVRIFHPLGAQKQPPAAHDPDIDAAIRELAFESEPKGK
jgi:pimeloyl-ACP methyl ester carboxylesterase